MIMFEFMIMLMFEFMLTISSKKVVIVVKFTFTIITTSSFCGTFSNKYPTIAWLM